MTTLTEKLKQLVQVIGFCDSGSQAGVRGYYTADVIYRKYPELEVSMYLTSCH